MSHLGEVTLEKFLDILQLLFSVRIADYKGLSGQIFDQSKLPTVGWKAAPFSLLRVVDTRDLSQLV